MRWSIIVFLCGSLGVAYATETFEDDTVYFYDAKRSASDSADSPLFMEHRRLLASRIIADSGIDYKIDLLPVNRLYKTFEDNDRASCVIGLHKLEERKAFADFSEPFVLSRKAVIIARKEIADNYANRSFADLLGSDKIFTVNPNVSFGAGIDALIDQYKPKTLDSTGRLQALYSISIQAEADYAIVEEEEAEEMLAESSRFENLAIISFEDMPDMPPLHFMCSKKVSGDIIQALNDSIAKNIPKNVANTKQHITP